MAERLGEVTVPSGLLTLLDPGHIGMFIAQQIPRVPTVEVPGLPTDRALPVMGERVQAGRWRGSWDHVAVVVDEAPVVESVRVSDAMVDFARLLVADSGNAEHWIHEDAVDGQADFVFWGRDAEALAAASGAPRLGDGNFGWKNLPVEQAIERGTAVEKLKEERGAKLATDFRPHSHHWALLEQVRASPTESGTIDAGPLRVCLFMTSWGDGLFPVLVDRDRDRRLVRVRVQLCTPESEAAMAAVNPER